MTIFDYIDRHPVLSWAWWLAGLITVIVAIAAFKDVRTTLYPKANPKDRPS